jgi:hypothetical protein
MYLQPPRRKNREIFHGIALRFHHPGCPGHGGIRFALPAPKRPPCSTSRVRMQGIQNAPVATLTRINQVSPEDVSVMTAPPQ